MVIPKPYIIQIFLKVSPSILRMEASHPLCLVKICGVRGRGAGGGGSAAWASAGSGLTAAFGVRVAAGGGGRGGRSGSSAALTARHLSGPPGGG